MDGLLSSAHIISTMPIISDWTVDHFRLEPDKRTGHYLSSAWVPHAALALSQVHQTVVCRSAAWLGVVQRPLAVWGVPPRRCMCCQHHAQSLLVGNSSRHASRRSFGLAERGRAACLRCGTTRSSTRCWLCCSCMQPDISHAALRTMHDHD